MKNIKNGRLSITCTTGESFYIIAPTGEQIKITMRPHNKVAIEAPRELVIKREALMSNASLCTD